MKGKFKNIVEADKPTVYAESVKSNVGADDPVRPQRRNTQNGITLIALIISIIVMLILAAVSINIIMNQGIITKSQTAQEKHQSSAEEEAINVGYSEYLTKKYNGEISELEVANATSAPTEKGWTITFDNGKVYTLSKEGEIKEESENENTPEDELGEWWLPTEQEKTEIYDHCIADNGLGSDIGGYLVVLDFETVDGISKDTNIMIQIVSKNICKSYLYFFSEELVREDINITANQWYCSTVYPKDDDWDWDNMTIEEYNGPCPVQKELFTQIYSESYLDRIIASFK